MKKYIIVCSLLLSSCSTKVNTNPPDIAPPIVGQAGKDGASCQVEQAADGALVTCGDQTVFISNGQVGPKGDQGPKGDKGNDGNDATPVTVVQLCPGMDSYPGVFVEDALCINNQLYAVYSIPNAFLTLLTPGYYVSTGIGSACNLTVADNCQVSH